jgi:hypothetical protein
MPIDEIRHMHQSQQDALRDPSQPLVFLSLVEHLDQTVELLEPLLDYISKIGDGVRTAILEIDVTRIGLSYLNAYATCFLLLAYLLKNNLRVCILIDIVRLWGFISIA